ncbi:SET domain-containing protein RMS1 [Clathrospora elynae]|uniref:SET domain-containing protein RMS1 n=1 Tax=Clathrospora elynae TaxID=706981 RepID=A0A6A5SIH1_9PLEO|nr:SET domain-containing protein RMS1 [Clathrospora elynae]
MDEFEAATGRFLAWFKVAGGNFRDDLLEIRDLRSQDAGRGIVAIKDVPLETTLFTIPRDAIINVQTSELPNKLPEVFDVSIDDDYEESEPLESWGSLILVMLYEFLQGEASRWKPYIDVLPQSFDTPLFWSVNELKELEGTCLTIEKIGKIESDDMLRSRIVSVVLKNPAIFYPEGASQLNEDELLALAHRMGSTIMSYAFDLENEDEHSDEEEEGWVEDREGKTLLGMVPMADILNANADFNAHVNHGVSLEVTTLRDTLPAGSEIFNYYGPLPSSELLRRYGYVTPEHHRYDVAEIPWSVVRSALGNELCVSDDVLTEIEAQLDEDELEDYFIIERDSGEPSSEGRLSQPALLREVSAELEEQFKTLLIAFKKSKPELIPEKRKRDEIYSAVVARALTTKLAQYPSSVEEDETLLKRDGLPKRHRMAVEVRLGEKRLLQEALALVRGGGDHVEHEGERAGKKAKR